MIGDQTIVRLAMEDEAVFLPDIERSAGTAFRSVPGLEWIADDEVESAEFHQLFIDEGTVWVAATTGSLTGFVTTQVFGSDDGDILHIWELAVADGYQGQGVGRLLMNAASEYASANDFRALTLTTFRDLSFNEHFYHKLGYKTLDQHELSPRLEETLKAEQDSGLPIERRCAMQMQL